MKNRIFILLILCFSFKMNAQECCHSDEELIKYIIAQEHLNEYSIEELKDDLFKIELNTLETVIKDIGVYKFGLSITHTKRYVLLKGKFSCKVVDFNSVDDGVIEMCDFFSRNIDEFSSEQIIDYIEKSINMFKSNQRSGYLKIKDE